MEIKGNERKRKSKETLETLNVLSVLPTSLERRCSCTRIYELQIRTQCLRRIGSR